MLLPIGIVKGKRFEQARPRISGLVAALHDLFALGVIARPEFGQRHGNDRVGLRQAAQLIFFKHYTNGIIQHAEHGLDVLGLDGRLFQVDSNDDFRAHLPHNVGRQVVQQSTIHIDSLSIVNR